MSKRKRNNIDLFQKHFPLLIEMRKDRNAAVDSMGSHELPEKHHSDARVFRFQALVSLMLSSQTKDEVTSKAMSKLQAMPDITGSGGGLTLENLLSQSEESIQKMIFPVSFYKRKSKYLLETAMILRDKYEGDIPKEFDELMKLKGVGMKMANLLMSIAWNKRTGIGVDVHVHRVANRLHWVETKTPEQTERELEDLVPKENWEELNVLVVGFGQQTCSALRPKCSSCLLNSSCEYFLKNNHARKNTKKKGGEQ